MNNITTLAELAAAAEHAEYIVVERTQGQHYFRWRCEACEAESPEIAGMGAVEASAVEHALLEIVEGGGAE